MVQPGGGVTVPPTAAKQFNCTYDEADRLVMRMSPAAMRAYMAITRRSSSKDGRAWPSYKTLADDCGVSEDTIKRGVRELRAAGVLRVEERNGGSNVFDVSPARPTKQNGGYRGTDTTTLTPAGGVQICTGGGADLPRGGVQNCTPNHKKEPDVPEPEVGSTSSRSATAREFDNAGTHTPADELSADPLRRWRWRAMQHRRLLLSEGTGEVAGTLPPDAAVEDVRAEVRRRRVSGDTVAEVLDGFLRPATALEVIYDPERAEPTLGAEGTPFDAAGAAPARFCAMLGATGDGAAALYARNVWDRVVDAAAWRELTPRVVAAAVGTLGTAQHLVQQRADLGGTAWAAAADAMALEVWAQVKAQRMSIRAVCSGSDRVTA